VHKEIPDAGYQSVIIGVEYDIPWLPLPNEVTVVLTDKLPPPQLTTSALALVFEGDCLLLTDLSQRGWDIPGGHLEAGEMPEEAMRREVFEEAGATLRDVRPFAYQRIRLLGEAPPGYRYPHPESYQVLYWGRIAAWAEFQGTEETGERALFAPEEALQQRWVQQNRAVYEAALYLASQLQEHEDGKHDGQKSTDAATS
jgi:8-oxo-dGTP pyrophosphatase MutT (NUDIX family)